MTADQKRAQAGELRARAARLEHEADVQDTLGLDGLDAMRRSCQSKRRYATPERAGQAAAARKESHLRAYACFFCDGYHLTRQLVETFAEKLFAAEGRAA